MRTMYKGNIQLTYDEYSDIRRAINTDFNMPTIKKISEISGENDEIFCINCTISISVYGVCLILILTSKNEPIKYANFSEEYSKISRLMGVKKISTKDKKGNNVDFLINIENAYDKVQFKDKKEFYKNKLNILSWQMRRNDKSLLENEICYRNFEDELDLVLGTCCILANLNNLNKNTKEFFLNKLHYVGIEIEDKDSIVIKGHSYNKLKMKDYNNIANSIELIRLKDQLLLYMTNLISLIINNDIDKKKDKKFIADIGYEMTDKYIRLYNFK